MEASTELVDFPNMKVENTNHFAVDDLLDFPQEDDEAFMTDAFFESFEGNSGGSSPFTAVQSCNSSISGGENAQFNDEQFPATELCVPYDDLAELEWLSNFVEDSSFSTDDLHNLQFIPTGKPPSTTIITAGPDDSSSSLTTISDNSNQNSPPLLVFPANVPVPGKARSKRPRAAPYDWSSRLLRVSESNATNCNSLNTLIDQNDRKPVKTASFRRRENGETQGRKCLHCASEKTPQWRTGPMGPKTLCNACGVRYKSGRLVPEYRPASSPTFISAKHSNSHRKVIELRRQKEMQRQQAQASTQQLVTQNAIFGVSNGPDDYLIYHQQHMNGPDYSHII